MMIDDATSSLLICQSLVFGSKTPHGTVPYREEACALQPSSATFRKTSPPPPQIRTAHMATESDSLHLITRSHPSVY